MRCPNLGDSFDGLVRRIGQAGLTEAINGIARELTALLDVTGDTITALRGMFKLKENEQDIKLVISRMASVRTEIAQTQEKITYLNEQGYVNPKKSIAGLVQLQAEFSFLENKLKRLTTARNKAEEVINDTPTGTPPPAPTGGPRGETEAERRAKRIKEYITDLQKEADTLGFNSEQLAAYELRALGASQAQIDFGVSLQSTATDFEKQQKALEATAAAQEELKNFADNLTRAVNPTQELADELARIEEAFSAGLISFDTYGEAIFNAMERASDSLDTTAEKIEKVRGLGDELGPVIADAFGDAIVEGAKFSDILKGLEKDLLRVLARSLITRPLADSIGGFLGGSGFSSFFTGRAVGGPVNASQPYVVGENGPELFPTTNGEISTNTPGATINVIVQGVQDAASFARNQSQVARAAGLALRQAQAAV